MSLTEARHTLSCLAWRRGGAVGVGVGGVGVGVCGVAALCRRWRMMSDRPWSNRPQIPQRQARRPCPGRAGCCGNPHLVGTPWARSWASSSGPSDPGPYTPLCSSKTNLHLQGEKEWVKFGLELIFMAIVTM